MILDALTCLHAKDNFDGPDLGLALVKKIVERHKGQIEASREPEAGATFTILLLPVRTCL